MDYTKLKISNSFIGRNTEGTIFRTDDKNIVFKRLHEKIDDHIFIVPSEGLKIKNFSMPLQIKRDKKNKIIGYYKDYIEGETMEYKHREMDFNKLNNFINEFDSSIKKISELNIEMYDLTPGNFVITNNSIHNIDVDRFEYVDEDSFETKVKKAIYDRQNIEYSIFKQNRSYFAKYILSRIGIYRFENLEEEYKNYNSMINEIAHLVRYGVLPVDTFIKILKENCEQNIGKEIHTVKDFINTEEKIRKINKIN